jgi:glycosyltransferase involved in cell wall biosynthesis
LKIGLFETLPGFGGGNIYQKYIIQALQPAHETHVFRVGAHPLLGKRLGKVWHSIQVFRRHPDVDLWICTYLPTIALNFVKPNGKVLSLFYHLDDSVMPHPQISNLLRWLYLRQARICDSVVVIAKYWRDYLEREGIRNTELIYWGFDVSRFTFSQQEITAFKSKYNLMDKPIVYLGNCQRKKGVVEAYENLKDLDAHLVTSGEERVKIPTRNLRLGYDEYRLLLRASDVVLTLSQFKEGWNATAHEAMLAGTPVIGSGLGGMAELLENGGQIICRDLCTLSSHVTYALDNTLELGAKGRQFARQFAIERFEKTWQSLIARIDDHLE